MTVEALVTSIATAFAEPPRSLPYRHWILKHILPEEAAAQLAALPLEGIPTGEGGGKRETHNTLRVFLSPQVQLKFSLCRTLARAMQSPDMVRHLNAQCGIDLSGTLLRIEYCRDVDGFWLEPHTDIGAKAITFLVYLSAPPEGEDWGTDLYDANGILAGTAPCRPNAGLAFIPAQDTWHGFRRKKITGTRRSLIINYVSPAWRSVHELAFPGIPVMASPA